MKLRILSLLAAMIFVVSMLVASHAPAANAVSTCGTTGTLGGANVRNIGGDNSYINFWDTGGHKHSVYYGHPQFFCPEYVAVNRGETVYLWCNQPQPIFWYSRRSWDPLHGKRKLANYCSGFHSDTFKVQELKN